MSALKNGAAKHQNFINQAQFLLDLAIYECFSFYKAFFQISLNSTLRSML